MDSARELASLLIGILVGIIGNFFVSSYYYLLQSLDNGAVAPGAIVTVLISFVFLVLIVGVMIIRIRALLPQSGISTAGIQNDKIILLICNVGIGALMVEQVAEIVQLQGTPFGGISVLFLAVAIFIYIVVTNTLARVTALSSRSK